MPIGKDGDSGNDTIDRYPPACREIEKILCVSDKTFKKIVKDFEAFSKQAKFNLKSLNPKPNNGDKKAQIPVMKAIKPKTKSHGQQALPYGTYEPSSLAESIGLCRNHRVGRMQDWHSTYGQGMYE